MTSTTDEKEIFDFLDSLPTDENASTTAGTANATVGSTTIAKSPSDALDFLDELEGKKDKKETTKNENDKSLKVNNEELEKSNETIKNEKSNIIEKNEIKSVEPPLIESKNNDEIVNDPITSIASWWSSTGSSKVSNQLSSLWGTAQSIGEQAQKQAEGAIKKAREQSLEDNIKNTFKELGISSVRENINEMLTEDQKAELMKLPVPDAKKALESLNSGLNLGISFVEGTLNDAINKINLLNNKDEIIEIIVVHDMKNFIGLTDMIRINFEDVMSQQVDGSIDVNVYESGTIKSSNELEDKLDSNSNNFNDDRINFSLFNGKGSDAEKLIMANIDNEIKIREKRDIDPTNESSTSDSSLSENEDVKKIENSTKKTTIYISLLAWTSNKDNSIINSKEIIIDSHSSSSFTISCILKDEEHGISISSQSQPLPLKWAQWIEGNFEKGEKEEDIDPSEWVIEWVKNTVSNVIGVTSQSYIIKRMGY